MKGTQANQREFDDAEGQIFLSLCHKLANLSTDLLGDSTAEALMSDRGVMDVQDEDIIVDLSLATKCAICMLIMR